MSALLTAGRSGSNAERSSSAKLAGSALLRLAEHGSDHAEAPTATVRELAARIRFTVQGSSSPAVSVNCEAPAHLVVPGDVVRAFFEASAEAVSNAVRHSCATRCEVRVTGQEHDGAAKVSVTVKDNGIGFRPELVSDRRLGIKVSIAGRMRTIGARRPSGRNRAEEQK